MLDDIFDDNKKWAEKVRRDDPTFFSDLSKQQSPEYLWIGCSDSRVPANEIIGKLPGEVFVHRNIANLVIHTDLNCLSVIQYAVDVLKVKHIIVCGHYGCGGVHAALDRRHHGLIDNWLRHIKDIYRYHENQLSEIEDDEEKRNKLCELIVMEQVANICDTTIIQDAWKSGQRLSVHGVIYAIEDGILHDLGISVSKFDETKCLSRFR
jgi:carbonic anhydrase